ncbi:deoxynucleoside triphosphate triphosphohydrolase SAMHD1-like isoform X3 [Haliotis rufescens]|uniref:deoxynucleoside triphosphate triphosphohydrolase SAMHD1-like isoform X3 n=1 Tax=Haliotis rufescens TaxID=6454 RepID=UPI00201F90A4|nr:deoxynucleoside triphosphate triphosphohydrolase SAMHD1-like isoform X3 [Haliotis rufescens]
MHMSTNQPEAGDKRKVEIVEGGDQGAFSTKQSRLKNGDQSGTSSGPVQDSSSKIFQDPVHGTITVTGLCVKIIDTPQFLRLRYLKQLGGGYFVYPGAAHNRFGHSIGTYYLAGTFARILQQEYPDLKDDEIKCIEIAGLCHDLGHGPFSHVFDNFFIPRVVPGSKWKHEDASVMMLKYLRGENIEVKKAFDEFDKDGTRLELIKDLIQGGKGEDHVKDERVLEKRKTRPFLYEIVNNANTGIDVDKWDYFARDCHMMGMKNNFDHERYMKLARIILVEEEDGKVPRICARDKEADNLYDMFHTRLTLHRRAYHHEVTRGVELMIVDALVKANATVRILGQNRYRKISECIEDMEAYSKLNDSILQLVELPITLGTSPQETDSGTLEAREIIGRIWKRDLYKCVGQYNLSAADPFTQDDIPGIKEEILHAEKETTFDGEQFDIILKSFDYGQKKDDPITKVWFYNKSNPEKAFTQPEEQKSWMLPKRFQEREIAIYSKKKEFEEDIAKRFRLWSNARKEKFPEIKEQMTQMPEASNQ